MINNWVSSSKELQLLVDDYLLTVNYRLEDGDFFCSKKVKNKKHSTAHDNGVTLCLENLW